MADVVMDDQVGDKRKRDSKFKSSLVAAAQAGAREAGSGLDVTRPPRSIPHAYNNNFTVDLTYCDGFRHEFNYGANAIQIFRMNSIYDPDYTNTGHQPFFRDLWASQYDYYTVLACEYELHFYNGMVDTLTWTSVGTNAQRVGASVITTLPTTNVSDFTSSGIVPTAELKNTQTRFFAPEETVTIRGTLTPGDFLVDAKDADSDTTWTAVGANPAVPRYFGYTLNSIQSGAITGQNKTPWVTAWVFAKLRYTVQFTQVNQSIRSVPS